MADLEDRADLAAEAIQAEARENGATIERAPRDILPEGPARDHLAQLAAAGRDVYVYQGASLNGSGVWNVWLESRRVPLADYVAAYGTDQDPDPAPDAAAGASHPQTQTQTQTTTETARP